MSKMETPVMTSLQTTVEKMMKDLNVHGVAVAVIKTVKLFFQKVSAIVI